MGWSVPVELIIGPDVGISYTASQAASQLVPVADFSHVSQVETLLLPTECESNRNGTNGTGGGSKAVVQIRVVGAAEPLVITCPALETAESIADLVDRYCCLVNGTNVSLWNKRGRKDRIINANRKDGSKGLSFSSRSSQPVTPGFPT